MRLQDFFIFSQWFGKCLGAICGYLIAGSVGAILGILIGHFFDLGLATHLSRPHLLYHSEKRTIVQKLFFKATFCLMGHIAKADGRVSEREIEMAERLMDEMRLKSAQKKLAKKFFMEGKQADFHFDELLRQLDQACHDNRELLHLFLDIQYRAAQVDGLSINKIRLLDRVFTQLGFSPLHQQYRFYDEASFDTKQRHTSSQTQKQSSYAPLDQAYALLEVTPKITKTELKRAYRRLLSRNHPDRLIAQGLPEAMIKMANDKTFKIRKAYELICQQRGWN
jgi:DnaJ like chaperone protein